jgi:hypothetical protein
MIGMLQCVVLDCPDAFPARPAHTQVLESGATSLHVDPHGWRVYADPAGHPFCLLQAAVAV